MTIFVNVFKKLSRLNKINIHLARNSVRNKTINIEIYKIDPKRFAVKKRKMGISLS
jgi:hypothetical protein